MMQYSNTISAIFLERLNRFVAAVEVNGTETRAHVKNTGRGTGVLVPGAKVWLEDFSNHMEGRKLAYALIAAEKGPMLINVDSQAPNKVFGEALHERDRLLPGLTSLAEIRPETIYGNSRLDFYVRDTAGREAYIEVKGGTYEENGIAAFPDAPTKRGVKHLHELTDLALSGVPAYIVFVVQMKGVRCFRPNDAVDPDFGEALRAAARDGVKILAWDCRVTPSALVMDAPLPVEL